MGLFHRKKEEACDGAKILDQYDKGELDATSFIRQFGKAKVFYSTPFGDHVDGSRKLFILPGPDGTGYNPVFSSEEHLHEFYEKAGRAAYTIIEGTFSSFLDVVNVYGDSADRLFEHFLEYGLWETREPNKDFNVNAYAYGDLHKAFGDIVMAYYRHYDECIAS